MARILAEIDAGCSGFSRALDASSSMIVDTATPASAVVDHGATRGARRRRLARNRWARVGSGRVFAAACYGWARGEASRAGSAADRQYRRLERATKRVTLALTVDRHQVLALRSADDGLQDRLGAGHARCKRVSKPLPARRPEMKEQTNEFESGATRRQRQPAPGPAPGTNGRGRGARTSGCDREGRIRPRPCA